MKLLFTIGSLSGGGAERVVSRLASCMAREGNVVEIALISQNLVDYPLEKNVNVKYINPQIKIRGLRYIFRCLEYRKEVTRFDPDVIISFTTSVNLFVLDAMRCSKYKIILSERNDPYNDPSNFRLRKKRDTVYHKAAGIVFQTDDAKAYFDDTIQARSVVILNPVEVPQDLIKEISEREAKIVTVGRLESQKNQALLIKVFSKIHKRLPEYRLEIYGDGALKAELESLIKEEKLEDAVLLMGYTTNVLEAISTAKLFVLPSNYEGMSNALLEAMALGLPVVSTDHPIGGARMVIKNGINGILTPVGDSDAMEHAVNAILQNEQLSITLSQNSVKICERMNVEEITAEWMHFIHKIVLEENNCEIDKYY